MPRTTVSTEPVVNPTVSYAGAGQREAAQSAVSWAAIFAGAVVAAALIMTLTLGGTGLGLLTVSPWAASIVVSALLVGAATVSAVSSTLSSPTTITERVIGSTASANLTLWLFAALLLGAFSASLAATVGGRTRDSC